MLQSRLIEPLSTRLSRRRFLAGAAFLLLLSAGVGCKKQFRRPHGELDLGEVKELLDPKMHIPEKAMLLFRDDRGWSVLSTRCTEEGCDLTYQDETLFCPCCRSYYDHRGRVISGRAPANLPWYQIRYSDGRLYADPGKIVESGYRFQDPELEKDVSEMREKRREAGYTTKATVPENLTGKGSGDGAPMFREYDPSELIGKGQ